MFATREGRRQRIIQLSSRLYWSCLESVGVTSVVRYLARVFFARRGCGSVGWQRSGEVWKEWEDDNSRGNKKNENLMSEKRPRFRAGRLLIQFLDFEKLPQKKNPPPTPIS